MPLPIKVTTPLGAELLFRRMNGKEQLGRLFEYEIELLGKGGEVDFKKILGKTISVELEQASGSRHWNGVVTRFARIGADGNFPLYRATIRPWLWLLTLTSDCKIHKGTVPDIVKAVFRDNELTDFEDKLSGTFPKHEYCVQYRETDFDFVSRLMESEGIYYYFKHTDKKHSLVLANAHGAHSTMPGYAEVPFFPRTTSTRRERDHVDAWHFEEELEPGSYLLRDFDFEKPRANLEVKRTSSHPLANTKREMFDYPGVYKESKDGETFVNVRLEELYAEQAFATGEGNALGLSAGALFKLTQFPRSDQNKEYLIVSTDYQLQGANYESGAAGGDLQVHCSFRAVESARPYRPRRLTPKPMIRGPQTAIVVGKSGEEIWTDEFGRVKLQFHWDRLGKSDENSSCWVRVAQLWAGAKWGAMHVPRIGQEVVVEFLEGDPDRPLVTGRVYNGTNKVPYDLPANQTQSGTKSRSSKGGNDDNFNEIRFEDKKGEEQIFIQAEKDMLITVEHDETRSVGNDRKKDVKKNETVTIGENRTETVEKDETITIKGKRTETVEKDETITVKGKRTEEVDKDETITIKGKRTEEVDKDETLTIKGARKLTVDGDETIAVKGKRKDDITGDEKISVGGKRSAAITGDDKLDITGKLSVSATGEIALKCGAGSITIKPSGEIAVKGVKVTVEGSAMVEVKSSAMVSIQGAAIMMK